MKTPSRPAFLSTGSLLAVTAAGAMCFGLTSCDTATGQGAGIGAASGAIIGGIAGGSARTAALGAGAGAIAGALIGSTVDDRDYHYGRRRDYPVGSRTGRRGYVISPYAPYYQLDCRGIPSGEPVRDPSCNRIFIMP